MKYNFTPSMAATLFVVSTPIGNLGDMTFRAVRVLGEVALVAAEDTRRTRLLLEHYGIRTPATSFHEHNELQKLPRLLDELARGRDVALVSDAGTPGVSDPGYRLIRAAIDRGFDVDVLPGPSSVLTALLLSGFPADEFVFLGFAPLKPAARRAWLEHLAAERRPAVFFEAPHRVRHTLAAIRDALGDRPIAACREMTKLHQEVLRGTASSVLERLERPRGEFTLVVGPGSGKPPVMAPPSDEEIADEFDRLKAGGLTRRAAIRQLASSHGLPAREVYAALERSKHRREPNDTETGP